MSDRANFGGLAIGAPESGKTTVIRRWMHDFLVANPTGIAIVHDTQRQFGDLCASYATPDEYIEAASKAAAQRASIQRSIAITGHESQPVAELALALGKRHNLGKPMVRVPIMLAWDETSVLDATGSTFVGKLDWEIATTRRHLGIRTAHNLQRPGSLPRAMYEIATDVVIFRLTSDDTARDLETKLGLTRMTLQPMIGAPKFRYAHWRSGAGLV